MGPRRGRLARLATQARSLGRPDVHRHGLWIVHREGRDDRAQAVPEGAMTQPLAGIRVADFSHVMAGPYASHLLRLMGAEVIKIEPKAGDNFRNYGADR